jgi:hypothetical protein
MPAAPRSKPTGRTHPVAVTAAALPVTWETTSDYDEFEFMHGDLAAAAFGELVDYLQADRLGDLALTAMTEYALAHAGSLD